MSRNLEIHFTETAQKLKELHRQTKGRIKKRVLCKGHTSPISHLNNSIISSINRNLGAGNFGKNGTRHSTDQCRNIFRRDFGF
jgi:hypothetical protein